MQYAHARICSILKTLAEDGIVFEGADKADLTLLTEPAEKELIRHIADFPGEIISAAKAMTRRASRAVDASQPLPQILQFLPRKGRRARAFARRALHRAPLKTSSPTRFTC